MPDMQPCSWCFPCQTLLLRLVSKNKTQRRFPCHSVADFRSTSVSEVGAREQGWHSDPQGPSSYKHWILTRNTAAFPAATSRIHFRCKAETQKPLQSISGLPPSSELQEILGILSFLISKQRFCPQRQQESQPSSLESSKQITHKKMSLIPHNTVTNKVKADGNIGQNKPF